jgi:hypothetical protein
MPPLQFPSHLFHVEPACVRNEVPLFSMHENLCVLVFNLCIDSLLVPFCCDGLIQSRKRIVSLTIHKVHSFSLGISTGPVCFRPPYVECPKGFGTVFYVLIGSHIRWLRSPSRSHSSRFKFKPDETVILCLGMITLISPLLISIHSLWIQCTRADLLAWPLKTWRMLCIPCSNFLGICLHIGLHIRPIGIRSLLGM